MEAMSVVMTGLRELLSARLLTMITMMMLSTILGGMSALGLVQ